MPVCKNNKNKTYTGKENTPLGRGYSASVEKVGTKKKGKDGRYYVVVNWGKGKRWSLVGSGEKKHMGSPRGKYWQGFKDTASAAGLLVPNILTGVASGFRSGLSYRMSPTADKSIYDYRHNGIDLTIYIERINGVPSGEINQDHDLKSGQITDSEMDYVEKELQKTKDPWRRAAFYAILEHYEKVLGERSLSEGGIN